VVNNVLYGNDNLNDTAFNQEQRTPPAASMAGPHAGHRHQFFLRTVLERIDVGLARSFAIREEKELQFQAQHYLFNHATTTCRTATESTSCQLQPHRGQLRRRPSTNQPMLSRTQFGPRQFRPPELWRNQPNGLPAFCSFPQDHVLVHFTGQLIADS